MIPLPLQKAPQGLLGAFDLKNWGRMPDEFGAQLAPIVDVVDNYLVQNQFVQSGTNPATAVPGDGVFFDVPAGFVWRVRAMAFRLSALAADGTVHLALAFKQTANGITVPMAYISQAVVAATATINCVKYFDRPFVVTSGGRLIGQLEAPTAAARTSILSMLVEAIPA